MKNKKTMIILADLGASKITYTGFRELVEILEKDYDIIDCKFFNYVGKRNRDFHEYISNNGYLVSISSSSHKKHSLDSFQVLAAGKIAANKSAEAVLMIAGAGDIIPVISELRGSGIDVIGAGSEKTLNQSEYKNFIKTKTHWINVGCETPKKTTTSRKK